MRGQTQRVTAINERTGKVRMFRSQQQAAEYFGVDQSAMCRWLSGVTPQPCDQKRPRARSAHVAQWRLCINHLDERKRKGHYLPNDTPRTRAAARKRINKDPQPVAPHSTFDRAAAVLFFGLVLAWTLVVIAIL